MFTGESFCDLGEEHEALLKELATSHTQKACIVFLRVQTKEGFLKESETGLVLADTAVIEGKKGSDVLNKVPLVIMPILLPLGAGYLGVFLSKAIRIKRLFQFPAGRLRFFVCRSRGIPYQHITCLERRVRTLWERNDVALISMSATAKPIQRSEAAKLMKNPEVVKLIQDSEIVKPIQSPKAVEPIQSPEVVKPIRPAQRPEENALELMLAYLRKHGVTKFDKKTETPQNP